MKTQRHCAYRFPSVDTPLRFAILVQGLTRRARRVGSRTALDPPLRLACVPIETKSLYRRQTATPANMHIGPCKVHCSFTPRAENHHLTDLWRRASDVFCESDRGNPSDVVCSGVTGSDPKPYRYYCHSCPDVWNRVTDIFPPAGDRIEKGDSLRIFLVFLAKLVRDILLSESLMNDFLFGGQRRARCAVLPALPYTKTGVDCVGESPALDSVSELGSIIVLASRVTSWFVSESASLLDVAKGSRLSNGVETRVESTVDARLCSGVDSRMSLGVDLWMEFMGGAAVDVATMCSVARVIDSVLSSLVLCNEATMNGESILAGNSWASVIKQNGEGKEGRSVFQSAISTPA